MTATATAAPRRSRKLLVPLATLLAATGIAFASGASFTTATASTGLVASGTLTQTNSSSVAFSKENLKPGDVVTGVVTITNTGSLPALLTVTEKTPVSGDISFDTQYLNLKVVETGVPTPLYDGPLGSARTFVTARPLGTGTADKSKTLTYTVTFAQGAPNDQQGKRAATTYTFDTVQTSAETFGPTNNSVQAPNTAPQGVVAP